jgi:hypothetical protein
MPGRLRLPVNSAFIIHLVKMLFFSLRDVAAANGLTSFPCIHLTLSAKSSMAISFPVLADS